MSIELTTAPANTITSIRETLSAASFNKLQATKSYTRTLNTQDDAITFTAPVGELPVGSLGKVSVTLPTTGGVYERGLLNRLSAKFDGDSDLRYNYNNIKIFINSTDNTNLVANVQGVVSNGGENREFDIFVDQAPDPDPFTVSSIEFAYDFVNAIGLENENDFYGMATDNANINIVSGRDINLRATDDIDIRAGSTFELWFNRYDEQASEEGIELITVNEDNIHNWTFDFDGNTRLPKNIIFEHSGFNDGSILSHSLSSGDGSGYTTLELHPDIDRSQNDQYIIIDPTTPNHIHIRAGGMQDNSGAELILGGESSNVRVGYGENPSVYVSANDRNWEFGVNGFMYFPDGGALKIKGTAPGTSIGTEGDEAGMIAIDNDYFYYCTATWNGTADIWKRVQFSASTW